MRKLTVAILFALGLHGSAMAGLAEGANAYNARNYALALKEITPLAKAGNADAEHLLGLMYYMGRGVTRDYKQAFAWHLKAAEQGKVDPGQKIVCTVTGNGLKDPDWAVAGAPQPVTVPVDAATAAERLGLA